MKFLRICSLYILMAVMFSGCRNETVSSEPEVPNQAIELL